MASISANGSLGHHKFTLTVTESSTSVANNTSTVKYSFQLSPVQTSWAWSSWGSSISYTLTINGTKYTGTIPDYDGYATVTLKSGSQTVTHNSDGSKSISYSFSVVDGAGQRYTPGNASASGTLALSTIPRASSFGTITGDTIGSSMTVKINRASSSFVHRLYYRMGDMDWIRVGLDIGTESTFTISSSTAKEIPNAKSGSLQLLLKTYNGSTQIGDSVYKNVTVKVPSYSITVNTPTLTGSGLLSGEYVQGKSKVKVSIVASANSTYGGTIKSYSTKIDGKTYSGSSFTTSALSSGSKKAEVTVTDSRGITKTVESATITVRTYSAPTITEFKLVRQSDETTVVATIKGSVASVNSKNAKTLSISFNGSSESITPSSYTIEHTKTFTGVPTDDTLTATATIKDSYTTVTKTFTLPTVAVTMDFHNSGKGIAMGKVAETSNLLDVAWDVQVGSRLKVLGSTEMHNPLSITDENIAILTLNRKGETEDAIVSAIRFMNNSGTLGYVGMSGINTGLKRWLADTSGAYVILDTGNTKDYIVEQGTSGSWTYEKWNSGVAKCYAAKSVDNTPVSTAWGSLYQSDTITLPDFPTVVGFKSAPSVFLQFSNTGGHMAIAGGASDVSKTSCGKTYLFRPASATLANGSIVIQAIGKWK